MKSLTGTTKTTTDDIEVNEITDRHNENNKKMIQKSMKSLTGTTNTTKNEIEFNEITVRHNENNKK